MNTVAQPGRGQIADDTARQALVAPPPGALSCSTRLSWAKRLVGGTLGLSLIGLTLGLAQAAPSKAHTAASRGSTHPRHAPGVAATNGPDGIAEMEIPRSVFTAPSNPKEGRNPFFPTSMQGMVQPKTKKPVLDTSTLVLNGIVPSGPKRTAMINNRTFEVGEEGEVKLTNGSKILVRCVEIGNNWAVVEVRGQRRQLHLRFGI